MADLDIAMSFIFIINCLTTIAMLIMIVKTKVSIFSSTIDYLQSIFISLIIIIEAFVAVN